MAGMFLFLGGCQKEENFSREIRNVSNKTGKYKPVFDTTQSIIYLGGRNNDSLIYLAPKISELLHMSAQLKKISNKHSLAQKAIQLKTEGSNWDVNYATITNSRFPDEYMITLPFVKNNVITGIFLFIRNGEDFDAKLFTAEDIEMFISSGITDNHLNRQYFYATNEWIKFKWIIERNADLLKSEWIQSKLRLISSPPSGRCWLTIFTIQIIEFEGLVGNTEFITITQTGSGYLWCMESHIHNDGLILGENYGGSTSGLGETEKDLKDKFIGIDTDCLSLLLPDMKNMLLNSVSPCDPDNFNNKITQAFNNACLKAKQDGGDNFLLNIEMWEFNDAMMEALDGVDYLDNNISDPRLNCLWKKLMKSNNNVICEQISYYEGKTKLNLSIWSQAFNGVNGSTTIDDNGQVAIQFNETNLKNKCDIEILKTMIHESVHAGILNVVKGTHINGWGVNDVPDLKYYYDNFTDFHHEYMAGNYFDNLVKSLKQTYGDKYSDTEYEALMWNGLHNTTAYKKLPAAKRNEIENIWDEFKNSKTCEKSCL